MSSKKILFATDYSEASQHALEYAALLAKAMQAKLYIVHVSQREQYPVGELFNDEADPNPRELNALKAVVPDDPSIPFEHRLLHGEAGSAEITHAQEAIVEFADKERVDMIVLGTHGRSGFGHMLMGSVAEAVVRHAHCPVVTVRQAKEARKESLVG